MANSKSKPSTDLVAHLLERLGEYLIPNQRFCVALSGGIDSVALLHAALAVVSASKGQQLFALHVNHGLNPHADEWEAFCKHICMQLGVQFETCRVTITPDGEGLEAAARHARYAALLATDCDWILLAHHQDDQAETVLLNMSRGAGVHGAAGMVKQRGHLLRPFLDVSRAEIADYARVNSLSWIDDDSNDDIRYRRNFMRHEVLPLLKQQFPGVSASLARAAQTFGDAAELLDDLARADLGSEHPLSLDKLKTMSIARGANLLRYYLGLYGLKVPSRARLLEMRRQLLDARHDSEIRFVIGSHEIRRFRNQLWIETVQPPVLPVTWAGQYEIAWAGRTIHMSPAVGLGIDAGVFSKKTMCFSPRNRGGSMQLQENGLHRPLKDLLREAAIPPWRRKTLPLLYADEDLVWAAGIGIDVNYRCKPGAEGVLIEFDGVTW